MLDWITSKYHTKLTVSILSKQFVFNIQNSNTTDMFSIGSGDLLAPTVAKLWVNIVLHKIRFAFQKFPWLWIFV